MKFTEDPRMKAARKSLAFAFIFYTIFLAVSLIFFYGLGTKPYLFGMPLWAAVGVILFPALSVILVIPLVEHFIPDVPLADDEEEDTE
jgi:uncharacterized membrane protein YhdT